MEIFILMIVLAFNFLAALFRAVQHVIKNKYEASIFPHGPAWLDRFMRDESSRFLTWDGEHWAAALNDLFNFLSGVMLLIWHVLAGVEVWAVLLYPIVWFNIYYFWFNLYYHRIFVYGKNERPVWRCLPPADIVYMYLNPVKNQRRQ